MHSRYPVVAAILLCGVAFAAGSALAAQPAASAGECFTQAFKTGSADAVAACYAEDAVMWFPGGPLAKGRKAIRDGFAGMLTQADVKDSALNEMGHASMGDTRTTWGTYSLTLVNKATGVESRETGRYTDVQKKINGHWLYIVDHPSDDPAPAAE